MVGVQVARRRILLAEQSQHGVGVLTARVLSSVRNAFAHVHGCEYAELTRPHARAACVVQGGLPQYRHLGPQNLDPFLGTIALHVVVSARRHGVHLGM